MLYAIYEDWKLIGIFDLYYIQFETVFNNNLN